MKLYADMAGGAAGDMILGAMIDCGLPPDHLTAEVDKLGLPQLKFEAKRIDRGGIACVKLDVVKAEENHHRTFAQIREMIESSELSPKVKKTSVKIFRRLAEAEGAAHNVNPENVHFHEVGAADSIADIVGAAVGLEYFKADGFYLSDFILGSGTVDSAHGVLPLPAPATLRLLQGFRFRKIDLRGELTTPTGAAILTACSLGQLSSMPHIFEKTGLGAGTRELEGLPSYFRLWLLQDEAPPVPDEIVLEANIDDINPEILPYIMERLFKAGAMDVFFTPVTMKKGRPGHLVTATLPRAKLDPVAAELFLQSTTIGLRWRPVNRIKLQRGTCDVDTRWGLVTAKWVEIDGTRRVVPEYEVCRKIADKENIPLIEVYREVTLSAGTSVY